MGRLASWQLINLICISVHLVGSCGEGNVKMARQRTVSRIGFSESSDPSSAEVCRVLPILCLTFNQVQDWWSGSKIGPGAFGKYIDPILKQPIWICGVIFGSWFGPELTRDRAMLMQEELRDLQDCQNMPKHLSYSAGDIIYLSAHRNH